MLEDEGVVIPPTRADDERLERLAAGCATRGSASPTCARSAPPTSTGERRLAELAERHGLETLRAGMAEILDYAERRTRAALAELPDGVYEAEDLLEDDAGGEPRDIRLRVTATIDGERLTLDFTGTDAQVEGNLNCPLPVTKSAAFFAVRVLTDPDAPPSAGAFRPVEVIAPRGVPAECAGAGRGGRRQRRDLQPGRRPGDRCARGGTLCARTGPGHDEQPDAGRRAASPITRRLAAARAPARTATGRAPSTWPCRTRSTPRSRPWRPSSRFVCASSSVRRGSGGAGRHRGGDGIVRELEALAPMSFTLITERRRHAPRGRDGGANGQPGRNLLNGEPLPSKAAGELRAGDRLRVETPGGGGDLVRLTTAGQSRRWPPPSRIASLFSRASARIVSR